MHQRSRIWILLPLSLFHIRRNGPNCQCYIQENSLHDSREAQEDLEKTLHWIRCKMSYSLLCSAIMCLRGERSSTQQLAVSTDTTDLYSLLCGLGHSTMKCFQPFKNSFIYFLTYIIFFAPLYIQLTQKECLQNHSKLSTTIYMIIYKFTNFTRS